MVTSDSDKPETDAISKRLDELRNIRVLLRMIRALEGLFWLGIAVFVLLAIEKERHWFDGIDLLATMPQLELRTINIWITVFASAQFVLYLIRLLLKVFLLNDYYDRLLNEMDAMIGGWSERLDGDEIQTRVQSGVGNCRNATFPLFFKGRYSDLTGFVLTVFFVIFPHL
ncbi:MAG: hypothetical protein HOE62_15980 [Alphaproteobacteria bacterium]|jgi:hypothetical protein|nr:hypothetical protein [Alphaproteobacteria bacterium]MBT4019452.1 hypothetical protein [Alphaproteobacteria bacterium]MBT4967274.1 hypothetical protein [Alphaproteobacteria bacterium]MBT5160483.1 hypothetical protein [Alphaproteobacteria bacterium]MBT5917437.1 hypothetical protein [Alphaproteobacteria bacterium]